MDIVTLAMAKKFTEETVIGGGAVVGKNVTVQSVTPVEGGNNVTFAYTTDDGVRHTTNMFVANGEKGEDGEKGEKGEQGERGECGYSPQISVVENETEFKLNITYEDEDKVIRTITTPNLKAEGITDSLTEEQLNTLLGLLD